MFETGTMLSYTCACEQIIGVAGGALLVAAVALMVWQAALKRRQRSTAAPKNRQWWLKGGLDQARATGGACHSTAEGSLGDAIDRGVCA